MERLKSLNRIKNLIAIYIGAVSAVCVPLFMRHHYFNLINDKAAFYVRSVTPAVIVWLAVNAVEIIRDKDGNRLRRSIKDPAVLLPVLIGAWALLSSLMSEDIRLSMWGTIGWCVGGVMTAVLTLSTIIISKDLQFHPNMVIPAILVSVLNACIATIQSAGIDIWGLLEGIEGTFRYTYLGTIGQKNSFAGYLCLTLPLFWGFFMACKGRVSMLLYGIVAFAGFLGIISSESDSVYAGIGICAMFILPFVFASEQHMKRASILMVMYGCSLLIIRCLPIYAVKAARIKEISKKLLQRPVAAGICIAGILLFFVGWKLIGEKESKRNKTILMTIEIIMIIGICVAVYRTAGKFNDDWGTRRGMIWRIGWEQFKDFPLRQKITGIGPEMLLLVYGPIRQKTGRNVVTAHSEPLQVLLSQGIIGLVLYLVFWGYLVYIFFKKKLCQKNEAVFFFPLAAYWGQSLFCTVYPITAVLFSVVAGMYLKFVKAAE